MPVGRPTRKSCGARNGQAAPSALRNLAALKGRLSENTAVLRHMFIVSREHVWLHNHLRERFQDDPRVDVILDRRVGQRRSTLVATPDERRRRDRRRPASPEEDLSRHSHYIVEL